VKSKSKEKPSRHSTKEYIRRYGLKEYFRRKLHKEATDKDIKNYRKKYGEFIHIGKTKRRWQTIWEIELKNDRTGETWKDIVYSKGNYTRDRKRDQKEVANRKYKVGGGSNIHLIHPPLYLDTRRIYAEFKEEEEITIEEAIEKAQKKGMRKKPVTKKAKGERKGVSPKRKPKEADLSPKGLAATLKECLKQGISPEDAARFIKALKE
jgi:hypothetical protein